MRLKLPHLIISLLLLVVLSACGQGAGNGDGNSSGQYEDEKMIGEVWTVHENKSVIELDISEWVKRDSNSETEEGYAYYASFSAETAVTYEDGTEASIDDIKNGQKLLVHPPAKGNDFEGHADEIVLLEQTYEEKYEKMLAHRGGYNIVIIYDDANAPGQMQDALFENAGTILADTEQRLGAALIEYDPDYVVDYKEELEIEQFPVILVFGQQELLFKAYDEEKVYDFFWDKKE